MDDSSEWMFAALLLGLILYILIYLFVVGLAYAVCWYIYKKWIKPQTLNARVRGFVSALVFGVFVAIYLEILREPGKKSAEDYFIITLIAMLAFPTAPPVIYGGRKLWQQLKGW